MSMPSASRVRRALVASVVVSLLGAGPAGADATAPQGGGEGGAIQQVIPPGQEEALANMLGRGAQLPGDCAFASGQVERTSVIATYRCAAGEVVIDLRHPSHAPAAAPRTERFALVARGAPAPEGLRDALLQRIREQESGVEWKQVGAPAAADSGRRLLPLAGGALVVVALLLLARRLLSRRTAGSN